MHYNKGCNHILVNYDPAYVIAVLVVKRSPEVIGYIVYNQDRKVKSAPVTLGDSCPLPQPEELAYYPYCY